MLCRATPFLGLHRSPRFYRQKPSLASKLKGQHKSQQLDKAERELSRLASRAPVEDIEKENL